MSERVVPPRTSAYVDSGVLIKLYVREPNSAAAAQLVTTFPSVKLYPFQELEIRNTLRALAGRTIITDADKTFSGVPLVLCWEPRYWRVGGAR